jgi:transposase-like protein
MTQPRPSNSCRKCGATNYRPVLERGPEGRLQPSGRYRCHGCGMVFTEIDEWRAPPRPCAIPVNSMDS